MPEIVGTFVRAEARDEGTNCSMQSGYGAGGDLAQVSLEFAEGHLDRVKVGRILRQIAKGCAGGFDCLLDAGDFVGSKIIDHHDVVSLERRYEAMLDIGQEHFSGHCSVEHHRRHHLVVTKRGDESNRLPRSLRHITNHPRATRPATVEPHHVGTDGGLVDKDQMDGVKQALLSDPASACPSHVRPLPFGGPQAFF